MWRGLYIAASGMITETKHTDMIANNLANASTTGYKRDDMAIREFEPMLLRRINDNSDRSSIYNDIVEVFTQGLNHCFKFFTLKKSSWVW